MVRRWLLRLSVAGGLFAVGVTIAVLDMAEVAFQGWALVGALMQVAAVLYLAFFAVRFILRKLLWRVGRRLLVSYLLLGFVPIPFFVLLGWMSLWVGSGHVAAMRIDREIDRAVLEMRNLVLETDGELAAGGDGQQVLDDMASLFPGVELVHRRSDGRAFASGDSDPDVLLPKQRQQLDLVAVGVVGERADLMVVERTARGVTLAHIPFDPDLRRLIESRTRLTVDFPAADRAYDEDADEKDGNAEDGDPEGDLVSAAGEDGEPEVDEEEDSNGMNVTYDLGSGPENDRMDLREPPDPGVGGPLAWSNVFLLRTLQLPYVDWQADDWHSALESRDGQDFLYALRTSIAREAVELGGDESVELNRSLSMAGLAVLIAIAISAVSLWILAALGAAVLVWRIATATGRLAVAFGELEEGRFDYRAKLRGQDQLAELIDGYNRMAGHLESAVEARAEREALDRELATARELQESLLPPRDFSFPGLGIAAYFEPALAIGGDFYHFEGGESRLDVVVGDVSGHGLGTGIVMAAARTLLTALSSEDPATVDLFERMDRQLLATTESRTFVTLVHCRFDLERGTVEVTNAGHVPPYRVRPSGSVQALPAAARPLGLGLPTEFHSVADDLEAGDLWILLSDGIIEARSPAGELLGFERWETMIAGCAGLTAEEARNKLLDQLGAFVGAEDQEDDLTLLVVRVDDDGTRAVADDDEPADGNEDNDVTS